LLPGIDPSSVGFPRFPASWAFFVFIVERLERPPVLQLPRLFSSSSTLGYLLLLSTSSHRFPMLIICRSEISFF
jgi:hypothetical protein